MQVDNWTAGNRSGVGSWDVTRTYVSTLPAGWLHPPLIHHLQCVHAVVGVSHWPPDRRSVRFIRHRFKYRFLCHGGSYTGQFEQSRHK